MKRKRILFISVLTVTVLSAFGFIVTKTDIYFDISKNLELFGKVYKEISFNYVDEIDPQEFMRAGIKGMLKTLDPYTIFIDEKNQDDINLLTNGKYGGVGISIGIRDNNITILEVLEGYSAQKQGVRVGDVITKIGDKVVTPKIIDDISSLVKGEPGTQVQLYIMRFGEPDTLLFNLIREEVIVKNLVFADFYPENSNNVYLKLTNFSRSAADEIRSALRGLKAKKEIKSIVLDLRGNPGGLLDVAVDICDKFLKKDLLIVSTRGRDYKSEKKYFAKEEPLAANENLVVLINGGSASASEIVAGAIQDHDRGVILGTQSFGKGLVQTITPLSFNTSLKVTTAKYYTPSGRCIQKIDYSKDNSVIAFPDSISSDAFSTDNKRVVYSAGGITPDTLVNDGIECDLFRDLLAKGLFFSFADKYFYENKEVNFEKIKDDKLLSEFKKFLADKNYDFQSDAEKKLDEVLKSLDEKKDDAKLISETKKLKEKFNETFDKQFEKSKSIITGELKTELAIRYSGNDQGIKEGLKYDKQFVAALELVNNQTKYNNFLRKNK
jgi:carboxyl-terminal processing protease